MQALELGQKESGKIWHRKPSPSGDNGLMLEIQHSKMKTFDLQGHNIRFLQVTFDSTGDRFVAGDHQGNIYAFDLSKNRFQLVKRTGQSCTALAFALRRKTEFLVALADCSLKCFDTDTKEMVAWMKGHSTPIHSISLHASGRYALTTSSDTALLWDLDTFTRRRKLNVREAVGISKVFFLPLSNTIVTCFRDDSIFAWESDTLECKYQLPLPSGKSPQYKTFSTSKDGRLLAAGGKSRFLHLWALDTRRLLRIIEMPTKVRAAKQVEFLSESFDGGASQAVGLLSQDGIMRFVHIHDCRLLFDIGTLDDRIQNVAVSPAGRHIVATTESGCLKVYSVCALMSDFNRPPAPLMKATQGKTTSDYRSTMLNSVVPDDRKELVIGKGRNQRQRRPYVVRTDKDLDKGEEEVSALPEGLDMERLCAILKGYGEYPAKYRMFIWRSILRLPENHSAFSSLVDKGTHIAWAKVYETYPIKNRRLLRVLQRTLSALAHWSAIFGEVDYLPSLAFPFVKLFQNNQLVCFEVIATVLVNWSQHWFEYFPNPPINMLAMIENILAHHDKKILNHFVQYKVSSQIYAWPLLQTWLSEVVTKDEWLKVCDNVFSQHPSFLFFVIVAYIISSRQALLQCTDLEDFKYFFHHRNTVDVGNVIKEAYNLQDSTPDDIHPQRMLEDFKPLTKGQYPIFNKYPKFIVDYQAQERERIRKDELEYLHQRQAASEMEKELERRHQEEEAWFRQQELLKEAEEQRRKLIGEEEQKITDQRIRLQAMRRELRMRELNLLDKTRHRFMQSQQLQKETELNRLDDEIGRKVQMRDQETQAAIDDVEIRRMELQAQKQSLQQEMAREAASAQYHMTIEDEAERKQKEIEEKARQRAWEAEKDRLHQERKFLQSQIARADQTQARSVHKKDLQYRKRLDDLELELRNMELSELNSANQMLEGEIHNIMQGITTAKLQQSSRLENEYRDLRRMSTAAERQAIYPSNNNNHHMDKEDSSQRSTFLNNLRQTPESNAGGQINLDRGRKTFERKEEELMKEVWELRQKIARENRQNQPPIPFDEEGVDVHDLDNR